MTPRKPLPAAPALLTALVMALLLALLPALNGCNLGSAPEGKGGGTEGEGLYGTVVDNRDAPVANARVLVFPDTGSGLAKGFATQAAVLDSARTDARGRYRFDSLPAGNYALLARVTRRDTLLTVLLRGIAHDGGNRDLGVIILRAGGGVTLTIRANGQPVAGARCSIPGLTDFGGSGGFEATSNASGICVLTNLPQGGFRVNVSHPTLGTDATGTVRVRSGRTVDAGEVDFETDPGPVDTVTVPPGTGELAILTDADTYVNRSTTGSGVHLNNNFGATPGFQVGAYDLYTIPTGLLRFPMPANVSSSRIQKAVLRIHSYGWQEKNFHPATITVKLHRILRNWKEGKGDGNANSAAVDGATAQERFWGDQDGTENWNLPTSGFNDADVGSAVLASATRANFYNGAWEFDVTALAKAWADAPAQNFGMLLQSDIPASNDLVEDYPSFYSREAQVADSLKPRLILTLDP